MKFFFNFWLPSIIWMLVIFFFSGKQRISVSDEYLLNFIFFKSLHLAEYAFLMMLNIRAWKNTTRLKPDRQLYFAFIMTLVFAVSDEYHQSLVPTREARVRDVIIDGLGACISWILIGKLLPIAPQKLKQLAGRLQII